MRVALALLTALFAVGTAPAAAATAPPACDPSATSCEGDVTVTTTVGTTTYSGLLYVPGDAHVFDVQHRPDGCAGCSWQVVTICTEPPVAADAQPGDCTGGQSICAANDTYLELRLLIDGVIQDFSHWCRPPGDPPPTGLDELVPPEADLRTLVTAAPTLHADPPGRQLAQLPSFLWADPPDPLRTVASVPGYPGLTLTLLLTPASWRWDFGDGSPEQVSDGPGGPYPNGRVRHTYRQTGSVVVSAVAAWRAQATLTTPFGALPSRDEPRAVSSPPGRERLTVRQARAVLIGGSD